MEYFAGIQGEYNHDADLPPFLQKVYDAVRGLGIAKKGELGNNWSSIPNEARKTTPEQLDPGLWLPKWWEQPIAQTKADMRKFFLQFVRMYREVRPLSLL